VLDSMVDAVESNYNLSVKRGKLTICTKLHYVA